MRIYSRGSGLSMSNTAIALLITILAVTVARIQIRRLVRSGIRLVLAVMIRRASAKELKLLSLVPADDSDNNDSSNKQMPTTMVNSSSNNNDASSCSHKKKRATNYHEVKNNYITIIVTLNP